MKAFGFKHKKIAKEYGLKKMHFRNHILQELLKDLDSFEELTPKDQMTILTTVRKGCGYREKANA